ncbi:hypothetical protein GJ496_002717 [Pomphorhynchus laevis]|nr:hypothetical protein GJ496_002717 [Pomphorhynchus laevis]
MDRKRRDNKCTPDDAITMLVPQSPLGVILRSKKSRNRINKRFNKYCELRTPPMKKRKAFPKDKIRLSKECYVLLSSSEVDKYLNGIRLRSQSKKVSVNEDE